MATQTGHEPAASTAIIIGLALVGITLAAYWPACDNGFVYDDEFYVVRNTHVQAGLTPASMAWAWTTTDAANWHPLTWLSLQLDCQMFGLAPRGFHVTNLILHAANVLLLFVVLRRLTGAVWRSALVAGLFGWHPLHVESVAWISERKDVLSTLFWLLTLWAYLRYVEQPGWFRYGLTVLALALGLLAKPMLVTLPFVLLLLDYWPLKRVAVGGWKVERNAGPTTAPGAADLPSAGPASRTFRFSALLWEKLPLFLLAAASCAMTLYAQQQGGAIRSLDSLPLGMRLANALVAYVAYLGETIWPFGLAAFYPHPKNTLTTMQVAGAGALLAAMSWLTIRGCRRYPYLPVGWFWYLGTLVPVIGLVQVGSQSFADRYTYVPLIGIFLLLVWGGTDLAQGRPARRALLAGLAGAVLVGCILTTWLQERYWKDNITLWAHALEVTKDNSVATNNLGLALWEQKQYEPATDLFKQALRLDPSNYKAATNLGMALWKQKQRQAAIALFLQAFEADPQDPQVNNNLGIALFSEGNLDQAAQYFHRAIELLPSFAEAHHNLGETLLRQQKLPEAIDHLSRALQLKSDQVGTHAVLGLAFEKQGAWEQAIEHYRRAVELAPNDVKYRRNLAFALQERGKTDEARKQYREAIRLDPGWLETQNLNAWMLATAPDSKTRNGALAIKLAKQVCQATGGQRLEFQDTLAAAHAELGQFGEAVSILKQALDLPAGPRDFRLTPKVRERLRLYEKKQPYREQPPAE